jgi:glycerate-2-kinase
MLDGFAKVRKPEAALAVVPRGYPEPVTAARVVRGGHPDPDEESFRSGQALLEFVAGHDEITFLISGGGSACAEVPLRAFFSEEDLQHVNRRLTTAGIDIRRINVVRKHLSAIKGGRLGARVRGRSVTLVYSDVGSGDLASVASGPTLPDQSNRAEAVAILERVGGCDRVAAILRDGSVPPTVHEIANARALLVADNATLTAAAAAQVIRAGGKPVLLASQIEDDVAVAARDLVRRARDLRSGEVLVAGGEPTVRVTGSGRGGRCMELGVRFALEMAALDPRSRVRALFGSSDGVDGNSGAAGVTIALPTPIDRPAIEGLLAGSDSMAAAARLGRPIIIPTTGNNLRDLHLVAQP